MSESYEAEQERLKLEIEVTEEWVEQREEMNEGLDVFIALTQKYGDVVKKTLKQIESARRMRKHRNPDNWDIEHEFKEWQIAMNRWRQSYQSGSISAEQFLEWLKEHKAYTEDWDYEENYI